MGRGWEYKLSCSSGTLKSWASPKIFLSFGCKRWGSFNILLLEEALSLNTFTLIWWLISLSCLLSFPQIIDWSQQHAFRWLMYLHHLMHFLPPVHRPGSALVKVLIIALLPVWGLSVLLLPVRRSLWLAGELLILQSPLPWTTPHPWKVESERDSG